MISTEFRHWQTVALSSEVPAGKPVPVVCGDRDFVLFRDADGTCRALADRCAHRRARLSDGRLTAQYLVECPYHGWRYSGESGACIAIPNLRSDEKIPKNYRVQAFETLERDGFIQILLGAGNGAAAPRRLDLPDMGREWQGEQYFAYPEELFMPTLVDCPSSLLALSGIEILDDHPFGNPTVNGDEIAIEYAAVKKRRTRRPPKHVPQDYAYTLQISASRFTARAALYANGDTQLQAAALIIAVPSGQRLTRVMWRGSGRADAETQITIECRNQVNPVPIRASNTFVSRTWAGTLTPLAGEAASGG